MSGPTANGPDPLLGGSPPDGPGSRAGRAVGATLPGRGRQGAAPPDDDVVDDWAGGGWEDQYWDEPTDDERFPGRGRRIKWVLLALVSVLLVGAAVAGGIAMWVLRQVNPPGDPGEEVVVAIAEGATLADISSQLEREGIVTDAAIFRRYLEWNDVVDFRPGYYSVRPRDSMGNVVEALQTAPEETTFKVTFPEGFTLARVAERLQEKVPDLRADRFLEIANSGQVRSPYQPEGVNTLEGLLFPDTYQVGGRQDEAAVIQKLIDQMEAVADSEGIAQSQEMVGLDPYQVLIVASLVEREAKVPEDRARIARVIYNRLFVEMPLQIDATVAYALGGQVPTQALIESTESPYNTYKVPGLPPTPIAMPGRASIEAALNPEPNPPEGPWLYYVVIDEEGRHAFAQTYEQHLANIRRAAQAGVR